MMKADQDPTFAATTASLRLRRWMRIPPRVPTMTADAAMTTPTKSISMASSSVVSGRTVV